MNVLHVVDSMAYGGAQTAIKSLMECGEGEGVRLAVLRPVSSKITVNSPSVDECPARSRFSPAPLFYVRDLVRQHRIEILHCHLQRSCLLGLLICRLWFPTLRLVFQEHGQILGSDAKRWGENALYKMFIRLAHHRVDHFLANSRHTLNALVALSPDIATKGSVVFVPVRPAPALPRETTEARRQRHHEWGFPPDGFVIGFAGRIIHRKGWRDLIEAAKLLLLEQDIAIVIAGDGPEQMKLERALQEEPLTGRARCLGFMVDMPEFYRMIDCLAVPSHWEPQGLVQIEAQSHGIPVVAAEVPGMSETLVHERNALLFPPGDSSALARCLQRIIADRSLREGLIHHGRENAEAFSATAYARRLQQIYTELP